MITTKKAIGGSFAAICALCIAQLLAQLLASLLVLIKIPTGICNIIAGVLYLTIAFILIKALTEKILKLDLIKLGMPKFSVKAEWILTAIILPVAVTSVYIIGFEGTFVSSNMTRNQIFDTLSAGIFFTGIAAGLVEEMVFRGFLLKRIKNKFGFGIGNLIQAVLFGLLHGIPFGMATQNILVTVLLTILPGAFGWYQGWLNEKRCGESIVSSWLLHGTMNFIVTCLSL